MRTMLVRVVTHAAPTTEQGQQIAQTSPSYDHPEFWDYLFRCVLRGFYTTAATVLQSYHAPGVSPPLQNIASETSQILKSLPRSTGYATEPAFFSAHRHWHTSVRVFLSGLQRKMNAVQSELTSIGHEHAEEERLELEAQFRCLLELLCGVQDRILEFSENWVEALCAWGTLVQPAMKRDDLPYVDLLTQRGRPADHRPPPARRHAQQRHDPRVADARRRHQEHKAMPPL